MLRSIVVAGIVGLVAYGVHTLHRSGFWHKFQLEQGTFHGVDAIARTYVGPIQEIGDEFHRLMELLEKMPNDPLKQKSVEFIGLYHDNPKATEPSKMRSSIGIVLNSINNPEEVKTYLKSHGYVSFSIPTFSTMYCEYPFTGIVSIIISTWKLYGFGDDNTAAFPRFLQENPNVNIFGPVISITNQHRVQEIAYFPLEDVQSQLNEVPQKP